jgi:hypothetical protein
MAFAIARHKVRNYDDWRPHYDNDEERRSGAGIRTVNVMRSAEDPNDIWMYWEVDSPDTLNQMLSDPDLKAKMEEAGVISEPEVTIFNN